ncbi:MAG: hypothetical protein JNG84_06000 [Archangium sp.]|nr:hypothetical protein [Archangium sp.]
MTVERLRQKVDAGERLSGDELRMLEAAAQQHGSPGLRTAVAQALINADAAPQAIPILEAVRRDFPRDIQVHLALGRALISIDKWIEAEASLRRALEVNPGDPEATKAMAIVAMRRGEWARANALVSSVLRVDPFDGEAQQLSLELEQLAPADLDAPPPLDMYAQALIEALRARSTPHLLQKQHLLVRVGRGGVVRLSLERLYEDFLVSGLPLARVAESVAMELAERTLGLPDDKAKLLERVLPVLRDTPFLERGIGAARREGPAGLWVFYALEDPELVRYVPEGVLASWGLALDAVDDAAWRNLSERPADVRAIELEQGALRLSNTPTGLWALAHGDGHDAARILTPFHQTSLERVAGDGPYRVYLGLRELVLIAREDDAAAVAKLSGLETSRDGIVGRWRLHHGRLMNVST